MAVTGKQNRYLTRHLFRSGCDCPTKLFYKSEPETYPERKDGLPFIAHIRFNKKQLKELLKALYPAGIQIEGANYTEPAEQTRQYLSCDQVVLFDAAFLVDDCFARVPVLEKNGTNVSVYTIQTRAFDPARQSLVNDRGEIRTKWRHYLRDLAYQLYVLKKEHPEWKLESYLVLPDKKAIAGTDKLDLRIAGDGEIANEKLVNLLVFIPVSDQIRRFWEGKETLFDSGSHPLKGEPFEECVTTMKEWYLNRKKVFSGVGEKCIDCEFRTEVVRADGNRLSGFRECWKEVLDEDVDEPHIFDLIGAGNRKLVNKGIYLQRNVPFEQGISPADVVHSGGKLTDLHRRVLQLGKNRRSDIPGELVKPGLFKELHRWEYPIHFLDFEAGSFAVPLRINRRPYHLVVFQYSCHTLNEDGSLDHHQWMHTGEDTYPNYQLAAALKEVPSILKGTLVQYSGFERAALKKILRELKEEPEAVGNSSELLSWLDKIIHRDDSSGTQTPFLADMNRMVKHYYYNIAMEGSLSIKDVLRSVMEISPTLQERFTVPYQGSNFEDIVWWQRAEPNGALRNPYEILREHQSVSVGRGTEAMVAYSRLRSGSYTENEYGPLKSALRSYCELDTLAMVMIYLHWKELLEEE